MLKVRWACHSRSRSWFTVGWQKGGRENEQNDGQRGGSHRGDRGTGAGCVPFLCVLRELAIGAGRQLDGRGFCDALRESELAKKLGNLLNRSLSMLNRYRGGVTPARSDELAVETTRITAETKGLLERNELQAALASIWSLVNLGNKYIDDTAPFKLAKDPAQAARLDEVLYNLVEIDRILAVLLWSVPADDVNGGRWTGSLGRTASRRVLARRNGAE